MDKSKNRTGNPQAKRIILGSGDAATTIYFRTAPSDTSSDISLPAIILVHGLGVSSRYMLPTLSELAVSYQVYAPDLPGFGNSNKPKKVLDLVELAQVLAEWLDALGLAQVILLGNSMGCQVGVNLAMARPQLVAGLVLVDPTLDPYRKSWWRELGWLLLDVPREPLSLLGITVWDYLRSGPRRILVTYHYMLKDAIEKKLPELKMPVLVIRGSRDPIVPERWAKEVAQLIPDARLEVIQGVPHAVNYDAARQLGRLVRKFIQEVC